MKDKYRIGVNAIGVIAVLTAGFIWFLMGTIGLYVCSYAAQMNNESGSYYALGLGFVIGFFVLILGVGIFRKKNWARKSLMAFWVVSSLIIIGNIVLGIGDLFHEGVGAWLMEVVPWGIIAAVGIWHIIFLKTDRVKEIFGK